MGGITERSDTGLPDYDKILQKIYSNIKGGSKGSSATVYQIFYESDSKLLDLWASDQYKDHPLFGGSDRTYNSDTGAVIFGSVQLIKDFLYGQKSLEGIESEKEKISKEFAGRSSTTEAAFRDTLTLNSYNPNTYYSLDSSSSLASNFDSYTKQKVGLQEKAEQALLNLTPLHPIDKVVLTGKGGYNKKVRNLLHSPAVSSGPYGDITFIPDEFQHVEDLSPKNKEEINKRD